MAATKRTLPRIHVTVATQEALRMLSDRTGAPQSWHRRRAYEQYIERLRDENYPELPEQPVR